MNMHIHRLAINYGVIGAAHLLDLSPSEVSRAIIGKPLPMNPVYGRPTGPRGALKHLLNRPAPQVAPRRVRPAPAAPTAPVLPTFGGHALPVPVPTPVVPRTAFNTPSVSVQPSGLETELYALLVSRPAGLTITEITEILKIKAAQARLLLDMLIRRNSAYHSPFEGRYHAKEIHSAPTKGTSP